ncbi:MAG: ABC transporter permease [Acidiferrobacterales bacterium]|nr:ABC transporter permease [Acidiferrobacterales bacterium]
MLITLARKSLIDRKGSVILTCIAMTISILVLLGVEHIRKEAKNSFSSTVSGVDLIVGARSGQLNLLLYSVFRLGSPVNNISWQSYQSLNRNPNVAWTIPISLGDSHKGYRVLGTNNDFFSHYSFGQKQKLSFAEGVECAGVYDVVLGAEVAAALNYSLGDPIVIAHGIGETSFSVHDQYPFIVSGILTPTGTPVDQTVHVKLEGIEAIHLEPDDALSGAPDHAEHQNPSELEPSSITAAMVGLKSRVATFRLQREINESQSEALMAILPGVALSELWGTMSTFESTLGLISWLVFIAALLGLGAMMAASIRERRKETRLLRIIGASPRFLFVLFQLEALLISLVSVFCGCALLFALLAITQTQISSKFGLHMDTNILNSGNLIIAASIILATSLIAALPAFQAYRQAKSLK